MTGIRNVNSLMTAQLWKKTNPSSEMQTTERANRMRMITTKLDTGKRLTRDEMELLKEQDPEKYESARQVESERDLWEKRLKASRTRKESREWHLMQTQVFARGVRMGRSAGGILSAETAKWRSAALQDTYREYRKSHEYTRLPESSR